MNLWIDDIMRPINASKRWDQGDVSRLIKLRRQGKSIDELMEEFGRTRKSIIARLNREGVYITNRGRPSSNKVVKSRVIPQKTGFLEILKGLFWYE